MKKNLVPDTWIADGEGALPELGPCPHDNSCVACRGTEMATSRFFCPDSSVLNLMILRRYIPFFHAHGNVIIVAVKAAKNSSIVAGGRGAGKAIAPT